MNYIHQLQAQVVDLNDQHLRRAERFAEFRAHLASPKYGPQADGERGDWISVADAQRWMAYIEDISQNHV